MSDQDPAAAPAARNGPHTSERPRARIDEEFSDFYRKTVKELVGFLINQGARLPVAADIAQDTLLKAYQRWADIHEPRPWAYTVASRALVRMIASAEETLVESVPEPTSLLARPDAIAEWEARYAALPMLRSLPPRQRQVLAWTLAGFTPGDIADHLGLPNETVRGNLAKARRGAAAYLRKTEEEQ